MINKQALIKYLKEKNIPSYRVKQILHAVYREGKKISDISVLPKDLKDMLSRDLTVFSFTVEEEQMSTNSDTVKTVFRLKDGKNIEAVLMRFKDSRNSVCVSSQVGCGLKCAFCATGRMGFSRNLTAEEITDQVLFFDHYLKKKGQRVTHVVFMGMGEPFLNYDAVMESVRILNDPELLGIAARNITVSTSGIIPGIKRFSEEKLQINLAISLHAPTQELREKLMPIAKSFRLPELMEAVQNYIKKTRRRVSYEYVMLKGVNDSLECAKKLAAFIKGQMCHVNLIPYNETRLGFENSGRTRIDAFKKILESFDIPVTVRVSLGQDVNAACGQLTTDCIVCTRC